MSERPEASEFGTPTWWHSRTRYQFALRGLERGRVLDLACGNGFGTALLAAHSTEVVGADIAADAVAEASRTHRAGNLRFQQVSPPELPFPDGSFDRVVCLETIEHMPRDAQVRFASELIRVLAPRGVLVLSTPDRETEEAYERVSGARNPWHVHTPMATELDAMLSALPHRRSFVQVEMLATVFSIATPQPSRVEWTSSDRPAPVAVLRVASRDPEVLRAFDASPDVLLRPEPRLEELQAILAASGVMFDSFDGQRARAAGVDFAPRWWRRHARYRYLLPLFSGRRVADLQPEDAFGLDLMADRASRVAAIVPDVDSASAVRRLVEQKNVEPVLASESGDHDVIVALGGASRPDVNRFAARARIAVVDDGPSASAVADWPVRVTVEQRDLVATMLSPADLRTRQWTAAAELADGFSAVPASNLTLAARDRGELGELSGYVLLRGDFQRRAQIAEALASPRTRDLGGYPVVEQLQLLAGRLARIEAVLSRVEPRVDHLRRTRPLLSVRPFLLWLRAKIGGSS